MAGKSQNACRECFVAFFQHQKRPICYLILLIAFRLKIISIFAAVK